ncbi:acetyltransferase [Crassaminicella indica]|uniref:Acetyltransferase n=1 Tax=Crassaminicella indica TaxID=2855394 RepID=A0ABX8RG93_9CLOT|nr:acetyltransferase [Crassaminicella indica]QXM05961.1 acetyltransferase [Crassaminicella indica]
MEKKIIILGGEGNGGVVAACILDMNNRFKNKELRLCGFLNDTLKIGEKINGYPVMGKTDDIQKFIKEGYYFVFAIHPIGHGKTRIDLFDHLNIPEDRLLTIVHPSSFIAYNAKLSPGVVVMPNCYIATKTKIGVCTLVMANSVIGHNNCIGRLCHFSAGSVTGSYINMGDASDIGLNATVLEKIQIGTCSVVGAGSLARKNIGDYEIHVGCPAKLLRICK